MALSTTQKAVFLVLTAVLLLSLTVAAWAVAKWGFARSGAANAPRSITVTDSAEVKVRPDTAFITLGVISKAKTAKEAAAANAGKTSAVIAAIEKAGIPKSDIRTVDYSLDPSMDWRTSPPRVVGYSASNSVRVRTRDMAKIGDLIDAAIAAGVNNVQGIKFDVEDKKALRCKALELAVGKAEGKAQAIAKALGSSLGPATSASESVDMYMPESRNYVAKAAAAMPSETPISIGESTVSAQVKVVYSVR